APRSGCVNGRLKSSGRHAARRAGLRSLAQRSRVGLRLADGVPRVLPVAARGWVTVAIADAGRTLGYRARWRWKVRAPVRLANRRLASLGPRSVPVGRGE